ncbi:MAG: CDP-alcohol phosphatidyltransferase family protein [Euzebyaceae bacterium]|nr:CDP-alcohol phosphatidyltransferase family protein [Euzebyaceae bacterium]
MKLFDAGARAGTSTTVHDGVVTAANAITALRLLGLPLFVWLMVVVRAYGIAFAVLVVVATTDWVDGYVARRFDQVTKLGKIIDPLIDRALLATTALTLLYVGFLPLWVAVLVVGRDLVLLAVSVTLFGGNPGIPVSRLGKLATACLLIGVPGFLLGRMDWAGAQPFLAAAYAFTVVGIASYYVAGWHYWHAARVALRMAAASSEEGERR